MSGSGGQRVGHWGSEDDMFCGAFRVYDLGGGGGGVPKIGGPKIVPQISGIFSIRTPKYGSPYFRKLPCGSIGFQLHRRTFCRGFGC